MLLVEFVMQCCGVLLEAVRKALYTRGLLVCDCTVWVLGIACNLSTGLGGRVSFVISTPVLAEGAGLHRLLYSG